MGVVGLEWCVMCDDLLGDVRGGVRGAGERTSVHAYKCL